MRRSGRIAFGCPSYHVTMGDTKNARYYSIRHNTRRIGRRKMFASCTWLGMRQAPDKAIFSMRKFRFRRKFHVKHSLRSWLAHRSFAKKSRIGYFWQKSEHGREPGATLRYCRRRFGFVRVSRVKKIRIQMLIAMRRLAARYNNEISRSAFHGD